MNNHDGNSSNAEEIHQPLEQHYDFITCALLCFSVLQGCGYLLATTCETLDVWDGVFLPLSAHIISR